MYSLFSILIVCTLIFEGAFSQVSFPSNYQIIGPFATGQREEGFDSLEAYGGIFSLQPGSSDTFPSELGNGGRVGWSSVQPDSNNNVGITYPGIDWDFMQTVFGWSIYMWYGYAIAQFQVAQSGSYLVWCTGVRQFWIDDNSTTFVGDFYTYRVGGYPIQLNQGTHTLYLRLQSSVRLSQSPAVSFRFNLIPNSSSSSPVNVVGDVIMPDVVDGYFSSGYGSITIANTGTTYLNQVTAILDINNVVVSVPVNGGTVVVAPGQHFQVQFQLDLNLNLTQKFGGVCPNTSTIQVQYQGQTIPISYVTSLTCRVFGQGPYQFTFLDYDNTAQYAMATPPSTPGLCTASSGCPVMVATHGAGVEANAGSWTSAIPQLPDTWILFPTGRRSWGYDWTGPSRINVFSALQYLSTHLPGVPSTSAAQYKADPTRIIYVGHSMGGYGCMHLTARFGDLALAAACAAGFVKLEFYVFYTTRAGDSYVDPVLQGMLMASIAENDNDLYSPNLQGIPLMVRYGQNDTNVDPWHSRRMARMVSELSHSSSAVIISEVPNQGHWFDGVLGDDYMVSYYQNYSQKGQGVVPALPPSFTVTAINPASFGGRGNLLILQLHIAFRAGKLHVQQSVGAKAWYITTENVRRFGINQLPVRSAFWPNYIYVDGEGPFVLDQYAYSPLAHFCQETRQSAWNLCKGETYTLSERSVVNYGPIRQIFETNFMIIYGTGGSAAETSIGLQGGLNLANSFQQYGRGSPLVLADTMVQGGGSAGPITHAILIGGPGMNPWTKALQDVLPVTFYANGFQVGPQLFDDPCQGIIFLSPSFVLPNFVAVIAGTDACGLQVALRAVPVRSGVVAGDYMVVDRSYLGRGDGGVLTAGYWDYKWNFTYESGYVRV